MATLIPSISMCASRMTSGERRLAQWLEDKLEADKDDEGSLAIKHDRTSDSLEIFRVGERFFVR